MKGNWLWKSYDILSNFLPQGISNGKDIFQRIDLTDHDCSKFTPCLYKSLFTIYFMLLLDPCIHCLFAVKVCQRPKCITKLSFGEKKFIFIFFPFKLTYLFHFVGVLEILQIVNKISLNRDSVFLDILSTSNYIVT